MPEITKRRMSPEGEARRIAGLKAKYPKGVWFGRKRSEEDRLKMRLAKLNKTGSGTNNWRGGITPIREKVRKTKEYLAWRGQIYLRDDYTCVLCGKRGGDLAADHFPKMFAQILDDYRITNSSEARDCEELWELKNGRTLCKPCHRKTFTGVPKKPWQNLK